MNFQDAIVSGFKNYTNFSTRATRSEFWFWTLFCFLATLSAAILDGMIFAYDNISPLHMLFDLVVLIPSLAVGARRLHDIDRTGWWQAIGISVIGIFVLIYFYVQPSQAGRNRFG